jgi:hypothetical protein
MPAAESYGWQNGFKSQKAFQPKFAPPPPKSVFNKVKPRSIPDRGPKPRCKPVSVSIISVVVYSVCQWAPWCGHTQEWLNRREDVDLQTAQVDVPSSPFGWFIFL